MGHIAIPPRGAAAPRLLLSMPLACAVGLAILALSPAVHDNSRLLWALLGASALLFAWEAVLLVLAARGRCAFACEISARKQHYLQACAQSSVLLYWGWYWPRVYGSFPLILSQILFTYAFDMLLSWSRRRVWTLGFAPLPVILSINLFLWFKPDWFYLQFVMVALGLAAKSTIRWNRDGRLAHIFNPSSFPLAVFSLALLLAGRSDMTWGKEIASTQFYPPHMYLALFLTGLPGQFFFGVTSMTMPAVLATYLFGRIYFAVTGVYFFYDSYIPIAVFLGMHLLFTDPSTSPRTELGRIAFGVFYGLGTILFYWLLGMAGAPTFYDKLLPVPLLNLSVKALDRATRSRFLRWLDPVALAPALSARQRNLAYISVWALVFVAMSATQAVGDDHPGQWLPFWRQACRDGRAGACPYLADVESGFCNQGSLWACNEAGLMDIALSRSGEDLRRLDPGAAAGPFRRGCANGFEAACQNLRTLITGSGDFVAWQPTVTDFPVILRGSKGEIRQRDTGSLSALACREGWPNTCEPAGAPR